MITYHDTYWCSKGEHQALLDAVNKLIPAMGEIPEKPALDLFRQASNCYYDLYNNGLCNRADEFERVFGFLPDTKLPRKDVVRVERKINQMLLAAAKEVDLTEGGTK